MALQWYVAILSPLFPQFCFTAVEPGDALSSLLVLSLLFTLMMYDAQVVARSSSMSVNVDRGRTDRGSKQLPLNTAICHFTHHVREKLYALPVLCNLSTHLKYADVFCV